MKARGPAATVVRFVALAAGLLLLLAVPRAGRGQTANVLAVLLRRRGAAGGAVAELAGSRFRLPPRGRSTELVGEDGCSTSGRASPGRPPARWRVQRATGCPGATLGAGPDAEFRRRSRRSRPSWLPPAEARRRSRRRPPSSTPPRRGGRSATACDVAGHDQEIAELSLQLQRALAAVQASPAAPPTGEGSATDEAETAQGVAAPTSEAVSEASAARRPRRRRRHRDGDDRRRAQLVQQGYRSRSPPACPRRGGLGGPSASAPAEDGVASHRPAPDDARLGRGSAHPARRGPTSPPPSGRRRRRLRRRPPDLPRPRAAAAGGAALARRAPVAGGGSPAAGTGSPVAGGGPPASGAPPSEQGRSAHQPAAAWSDPAARLVAAPGLGAVVDPNSARPHPRRERHQHRRRRAERGFGLAVVPPADGRAHAAGGTLPESGGTTMPGTGASPPPQGGVTASPRPLPPIALTPRPGLVPAPGATLPGSAGAGSTAATAKAPASSPDDQPTSTVKPVTPAPLLPGTPHLPPGSARAPGGALTARVAPAPEGAATVRGTVATPMGRRSRVPLSWWGAAGPHEREGSVPGRRRAVPGARCSSSQPRALPGGRSRWSYPSDAWKRSPSPCRGRRCRAGHNDERAAPARLPSAHPLPPGLCVVALVMLGAGRRRCGRARARPDVRPAARVEASSLGLRSRSPRGGSGASAKTTRIRWSSWAPPRPRGRARDSPARRDGGRPARQPQRAPGPAWAWCSSRPVLR